MATSANLPPGAIPANATSDPFTAGPGPGAGAGALRYGGPLDPEQFTAYSASSPSQAKRALEAHLKDTDRRIQDASRLGTTLLQQRKELSARLEEVTQVEQEHEVPDALRKKLVELEREYNEVGKESARAFLPRTKVGPDSAAPTVLGGSGRESPTKVSAPSRRQRNQSSNRVHDIEFATEISTSLLAQVRQLQAALAEKDEELQNATAQRAQLEAEAAGMVQRIKQLDDSEQRSKDENWNLEMKIQELEGSLRETSDKHERASQNLKAMQTEKSAAQRELDDLRASHDKLTEDQASNKRQHEGDLHALRREAATHVAEKETLQKRIEELTAQNTELARAVSSRWNAGHQTTDTDFVSAAEDRDEDAEMPEHSLPASPVKGTPGHGMLESETLKSSLNHAHRMIQNLKNNIHREKTEKIELKRMLQDARDEIESRRASGGGESAFAARKRRSENEALKNKRPAPLSRLGATRSSTTEILEDDSDWEEHDGQMTPSKPRFPSTSSTFDYAAFGREQESSTDAFETANERETTTENDTEAFETGHEDLTSDGEATETEGSAYRAVRPSPLTNARAGDRRSFLSTASTSAGEDDEVVRTPVQAQGQKYRLRVNRNGGARRSGRVSDVMAGSSFDSPGGLQSPDSSIGTPGPATGQNLGDELEGLDDDGTPSRFSSETPETERFRGTPARAFDGEEDEERDAVLADGTPTKLLPTSNLAASEAAAEPVKKVEMVDSGIMTEPWEPAPQIIYREPEADEKHGLGEKAAELGAAALAGVGLGSLVHGKPGEHEAEARSGADAEADWLERPVTALGGDKLASAEEPESLTAAVGEPMAAAQSHEDLRALEQPAQDPIVLSHAEVISQETAPLEPLPVREAAAKPEMPIAAAAPLAVQAAEAQNLEVSSISARAAEPVEPPPDQISAEKAFGFSGIEEQNYEPVTLPPTPATPLVPKRSSRRLDHMFETDAPAIPGTESAQPGAGFFDPVPAAAPSLLRKRSSSVPSRPFARFWGGSDESRPHESMFFGGVRQGTSDIPTLVFGGQDEEVERDANFVAPQDPSLSISTPMMNDRGLSKESLLPVTKPLQIRKPTTDEGSQTTVGGPEIEDMLRNKGRTSSFTSSGSPTRGNRRSIDGVADPLLGRGPRRPASAGSIRNKSADVPPLPENFTQKITAAQRTESSGSTTAVGAGTAGTMGPPLLPASAYKNRPKTPGMDAARSSKDGTTPRPVRHRDSRSQVPQSPSGTAISRRTSVSSFASELDERFAIHRDTLPYPSHLHPSTDPRMIQAITQTMIGEFLWKYTRKAGRAETSTTRHRRFFWVHPYTRTLYWSESDPSTAGRNMLKAKSLAITSVRVISDENAYPPGLHRKSIVVVTPGREIVFTAPTAQRHETWFNALSYLLLRTTQEKAEERDKIAGEEDGDLAEFNPSAGAGERGFSFRRSISRMTGRGRSESRSRRESLSSYHSRTTRDGSPQKRAAPVVAAPTGVPNASLAAHRSSAAARASTQTNATAERPSLHARDAGAASGRLSSFSSRFHPSTSTRGSYSGSRTSANGRVPPGLGDPSDIYDASVVSESAEDLRGVIERQEREAGGRVENVRACCDGKCSHPDFQEGRARQDVGDEPVADESAGKHDVGSLSNRSGRHSSLGGRFGSHAHGHHGSHSHPPRAEPMKDSTRPRRGE